jgi:hypothetical protein
LFTPARRHSQRFLGMGPAATITRIPGKGFRSHYGRERVRTICARAEPLQLTHLPLTCPGTRFFEALPRPPAYIGTPSIWSRSHCLLTNISSKCTISLAQPLPHLPIPSTALRILNATNVIPDAALFVPPAALHALSHPARSSFKKLKRAGAPGTFATQATPCAQLPALPAFEAAASFWEDKKAAHPLLEDAYRQNRMATAAGARQLHALHTHAPLVGLIWADGTVRAHVDWASGGWDEQPVRYRIYVCCVSG